MNLEIRADGLHISGYVNVTEKMSRPVITGKGQKVIEVIEPRAFEKALSKAENVPMTKDHGDLVLSETRAGNLELYEDAIGLHYDTLITDDNTITEARANKIKGLSFGMTNIIDKIEERANELPLRRISGLDLDHITLVVNKVPAYAATSIEMRADSEDPTEMEYRGDGFTEYKTQALMETTTRYFDDGSQESEKITAEKSTVNRVDNAEYHERIKALS